MPPARSHSSQASCSSVSSSSACRRLSRGEMTFSTPSSSQRRASSGSIQYSPAGSCGGRAPPAGRSHEIGNVVPEAGRHFHRRQLGMVDGVDPHRHLSGLAAQGGLPPRSRVVMGSRLAEQIRPCRPGVHYIRGDRGRGPQSLGTKPAGTVPDLRWPRANRDCPPLRDGSVPRLYRPTGSSVRRSSVIDKKRSWQTIRRFAMTSILKRDPRVSRPPGGLYRNYRRGLASGWSQIFRWQRKRRCRHALPPFTAGLLAPFEAASRPALSLRTAQIMAPDWPSGP